MLHSASSIRCQNTTVVFFINLWCSTQSQFQISVVNFKSETYCLNWVTYVMLNCYSSIPMDPMKDISILWRILIQCHFPFILIVMWDNVGNVLVMFGNNPKWQNFFGYALIDWDNWLIDTSPELHSHALLTPYFFSRWTMLSIFPHGLFSPYSHIISSRSSIPEISCE